MESSRWNELLDWIAAHPLAAGLVIFLIAFCDALLIIGVVVPAAPLLFAVGTLVGLGHIDGIYAVACAALGAFCGDGVSYVAGRRYGDSLKQRWPFAQHPEWLARGDASFRRHGMKSLVIGRFVGAIRPFSPAIAGMLAMPAQRYAFATAIAAILWALAFLLPGWLFGASLDLVAAVAGRLAIVIALVLVLVAALWASVFYLWRWLVPHAEGLLAAALDWSHRHPVLGRYSEALIDPRRRESPSLLVFALGLVVAVWGFFQLLVSVDGGDAPSRLDTHVNRLMFGLRHPLADPLMGGLGTLGDPLLLLGPVLLVFGWLWWRRQRVAAWHWLVAPLAAGLISLLLGWLIELPAPPTAMGASEHGFPSLPITLATSVYGFFAVLVARELPGRARVWPYVVAALVVGLLAFAQLYLGTHWLSEVLAGASLGLLWTTALGIAYRRRTARAFWMKPVAALFFGAALLSLTLLVGERSAAQLARLERPIDRQEVALQQWIQADPGLYLPQRRNELRDRDAWPLNLQYAGEPAQLQALLETRGWQRIEPGDWRGLLRMLDDSADAQTLPVMPTTHLGRPETLLMEHPGESETERVVLRLWPAPYRLSPDGDPLWLGTVHTLRYSTRGDGFVRYWAAEAQTTDALERLRADGGAWRVGGDDGRPLRLRAPHR